MTSSRSPSDDLPSTSSEALKPAQFATEFQQCHRHLWLFAAGMLGDRHLAEDVVQDAGVIALNQLNEFKAGTNFLAWMTQIVRYQAFNQSRKRKRRSTQSVDPIALDAEISSPSAANQLNDATVALSPEQTFFDDEVMQALLGLRDVARTCLLLRTLHQLSYTEIAAMLNIAEGTAMSHVHRSKGLLRRSLASRGNDPNESKEPRI